ncbi:hypothetical protein [Candidatus Finniella inopinata]|uniref:Uncharacterized protein n=1 Tax=Candidatus Finniella inopinata TaxID=1696036 RepID=A0A4Q7DIY1_9PROT|nr:hypothetical protein [Candidatus Finniella inopinata]RZI46941.1 hypothetical protein EQU50_01575 [Candidatus Finniella inopinata]
MKFLKNIAMAAALSTMLSAGAMASVDFELEANGSKASKLNFTADLFEASVKNDGTKFGAGSSEAAREILDSVSAEIIKLAKEADSTKNDNDIIALVKTNAAAEVLNLNINASTAKNNLKNVVSLKPAVRTFAESIVAKLGLKDKDVAAIEAMSISADWNTIKSYKTETGETLESLASDSKTAKGKMIGTHTLAQINANLKNFVEHAKQKADRDALEAERDHHKSEYARIKAAHDVLAAAPKEDPAQKASHEALTSLEATLKKAGLADASELPGYKANDGAGNLKALCTLVIELSTSNGDKDAVIADLTKKLVAAEAAASKAPDKKEDKKEKKEEKKEGGDNRKMPNLDAKKKIDTSSAAAANDSKKKRTTSDDDSSESESEDEGHQGANSLAALKLKATAEGMSVTEYADAEGLNLSDYK